MCSVVCSLSLFDRQQTLRKCGNISKGSSYSIQVTHLTLWNKKWPDFCIQLTGKIRLSSNDRFYIPEVQLEDESGGIYSNKWTLKENGNSSSTLTGEQLSQACMLILRTTIPGSGTFTQIHSRELLGTTTVHDCRLVSSSSWAAGRSRASWWWLSKGRLASQLYKHFLEAELFQRQK